MIEKGICMIPPKWVWFWWYWSTIDMNYFYIYVYIYIWLVICWIFIHWVASHITRQIFPDLSDSIEKLNCSLSPQQQDQGQAAPLLSGLSLSEPWTYRGLSYICYLDFNWVVISLYFHCICILELSRCNIALQNNCLSFRFHKVYLHTNAIKP